MAHQTETVTGVNLTSEEKKTLLKLLKHPKMKALADEVKEKEKK